MFTLPCRQAETFPGGGPRAHSLFVARVEFVELAKKYDVVNLGQGFPDFPPPDFAVQAFQQAVSGDFMLNQYTKAFVSLLHLLKVLTDRHQHHIGDKARGVQPRRLSSAFSITERLLCPVPQVPMQKADREPFTIKTSGPAWEEGGRGTGSGRGSF